MIANVTGVSVSIVCKLKYDDNYRPSANDHPTAIEIGEAWDYLNDVKRITDAEARNRAALSRANQINLTKGVDTANPSKYWRSENLKQYTYVMELMKALKHPPVDYKTLCNQAITFNRDQVITDNQLRAFSEIAFLRHKGLKHEDHIS